MSSSNNNKLETSNEMEKSSIDYSGKTPNAELQTMIQESLSSDSSSVSSVHLNPTADENENEKFNLDDFGGSTSSDNTSFDNSNFLLNSELDYDYLPSEETLENLLQSSSSPYLSESNDIKSQYSHDDDDDEFAAELSRLAAAEEDIRTELEMLMSTGFHHQSNGSNSETNDIISNHGNDNSRMDENQSLDDDSIPSQENEDSLSHHSLSQINENSVHSSLHQKETPCTPILPRYGSSSMPIDEHDDDEQQMPYRDLDTFQDPSTPNPPSPTTHSPHLPPAPEAAIPATHKMTNEEYLQFMKEKWQSQADAIGICKLSLNDDSPSNINNQNTNALLHTCPLLADNSIQKIKFTSEITATPELSPEHKRIIRTSNLEYIQPMSSHYLRQLYVGLVLPPPRQHPKPSSNSSSKNTTMKDPTEPLPIRTCALRIRPDVLCGSVMDTLSHAVTERNGDIVKRQGGHMMAKVPGFWLRRKDRKYYNLQHHHNMQRQQEQLQDGSSAVKKKKRKVWLPPFCFDAQLCTKKNMSMSTSGTNTTDDSEYNFERILLIRVYGMNIDNKNYDKNGNTSSNNNNNTDHTSSILDPSDEDDFEYYGKRNNEKVKEKFSDERDILRQASYIAYQMERVEEQINDHSNTKSQKKKIQDVTASPILPGITSSQSHQNHINTTKTHYEPGVVSRIGKIITSPIRLLTNSSSTGADNTNIENKSNMPALSSSNNHLLESTFRFFAIVVSELETRELSYYNLIQHPFGKFPALPTLDTQYCTQLRIICREAMILELIETASGMERYARNMERSCLEFVKTLIEGVIRDYGMMMPTIPRLVPLNAYPLDFRSPEDSCPPWGQKVKDTLEKIAKDTSELYLQNTEDLDTLNNEYSHNLEGALLANKSVRDVVTAFAAQLDEEKCARLARKNMQVMDRMAKMQALKRDSMIYVRDAFEQNRLATKAAHNFHSFAKGANAPRKSREKSVEPNGPSSVMEYAPFHQVPLLKCGILVGGATGTCFVTYYQILFVTQSIPILGGSQRTLLNLADVEFLLTDNPNPPLLFKSKPQDSISVRFCDSGRHNSIEVLIFIPSMGASRFKRFIDLVRSVHYEDPETLKLTPKGGLIYMADESR